MFYFSVCRNIVYQNALSFCVLNDYWLIDWPPLGSATATAKGVSAPPAKKGHEKKLPSPVGDSAQPARENEKLAEIVSTVFALICVIRRVALHVDFLNHIWVTLTILLSAWRYY